MNEGRTAKIAVRGKHLDVLSRTDWACIYFNKFASIVRSIHVYFLLLAIAYASFCLSSGLYTMLFIFVRTRVHLDGELDEMRAMYCLLYTYDFGN